MKTYLSTLIFTAAFLVLAFTVKPVSADQTCNMVCNSNGVCTSQCYDNLN